MSEATFVGLPAELRILIYEYAYDAKLVRNQLIWQERLSLTIHGDPEKRNSPGYRIPSSPFSLLRVCREIYQELAPLLPSIADVEIHFSNLRQQDADSWCRSISPQQVAEIRHLKISAWENCHLPRRMYSHGHRYNCHFTFAGVCTKGCLEAATNEYDTHVLKVAPFAAR